MAYFSIFSTTIIYCLLSTIYGNLQNNKFGSSELHRISREVESDSCNRKVGNIIEAPLRVGSWNTQRFGRKKIQNATIANYIAQIINRFDILALQEVVDSSQEAIYELLDIVNEIAHISSDDYDPNDVLALPVPAPLYNITISERVGITSYKEQYAVFYRTDVVSVRESIQYLDEAVEFTYDPFIVVFNTPTIDLETITLVTIHTSPKTATEEIDSLLKVYDYITTELELHDIMFLGDFNAGCKYVTSKDWESLRLFLDERFTWLISDHVDTTTKYTTCPYDRIVITGNGLTEIAYENSARAYHFDDELNITDLDLVASISDHFPVKVLLKGKINTNITTIMAVTVGPIFPPQSSLNLFYKNCEKFSQLESEFVDILYSCTSYEPPASKATIVESFKKAYFAYGSAFINHTIDNLPNKTCLGENWNTRESKMQTLLSKCGNRPFYKISQGNIKQLGFAVKNLQSLIEFLEKMSSRQSCIFTDEVFAILQHKLQAGSLVDASLYMEKYPDEMFISIFCIKNMCYISANSIVPIM